MTAEVFAILPPALWAPAHHKATRPPAPSAQQHSLKTPRPSARRSHSPSETMTYSRLCPKCGQVYQGRAGTHCAHIDEARRLQRRRESGRNTATWASIRKQVIARDGQCIDCGTDTDLTAHHLRYPATTTNDAVCLCRSCHGVRDGGRAA